MPQVAEHRFLKFILPARAFEAVKAGIPIPPQMIAEMSDWPNKDVIVEEIKRQQEMQAQMQAADAAQRPALTAGSTAG